MADNTETIVVRQLEGERLALDAELAVHGDPKHPTPILHGTAPHHPLVHMVCWDEDDVCRVEHEGRVTVAGDPDAPVALQVRHEFTNDHHQTLAVDPLDHSLKVSTSLSEPFHHALQLRTPLQVRFCNPWHVASDYTLDVRLGKRSLLSLRLTGATVATPQPCEDPCPEPRPHHPDRP